MPERLPIKDAEEIAKKRGLRQVILMAWDGKRTHCVTYGKTLEDCDQAALGGERIKQALNWPIWQAEPSRVSRLVKALGDLVFAARTSGGTAGRDEALCMACDEAEKVLGSRGREGGEQDWRERALKAERLLRQRDQFIVSQGFWVTFVDQVGGVE